MKPLPPALLAFAGVTYWAWTALPCRAALEPRSALTFTWNAPEECPSQEEVRREIARLLGGAIRIAQGEDLDVRAEVAHGQDWSVSLATRRGGRTGVRSIEAPSCHSLAEVTALIIALMIDPDAVDARSQEAKEDPSSAPASVAIAALPVASQSVGARDFLVHLHTQASLGTLPGADVAIALGVGLAGRRWSMEIRGAYSLRRDQVAYLSSLPGAYGRFNIAIAALSGCFNLGQPGFAYGPCAVGEGGVVSAEGYGADLGFSKRAPWVALGGGSYLSWTMERHLRAALHLDVLAPVWRPVYAFSGVPGVVFQAPAVGFRVLAGVGWRF